MTAVARVAEAAPRTRVASGAPVWLIASTAALGLLILAMALAETNLWLHYLIDGGEYISLAGLLFIAGAGVVLRRQQRLAASLPLAFPWLLFPVITQGDQIIDNLSIVPMRIITHILLAAIFAAPVAVIVLAVRTAVRSGRVTARTPLLTLVPGVRLLLDGRTREGTAMFTASLLTCEIWMAVAYLGSLMVGTLALLILGVLSWGASSAPSETSRTDRARARSERSALVMLMVGVAASLTLYVGFKNRPGAYQGSPSFLMDPRQQDSGYPLDRITVPSGASVPPSTDALHEAFVGYGKTFRRLVDGYYVLDRNYTWHFHNELFLRSTPLLPNYRAVGLQKIHEAKAMEVEADRAAALARPSLPSDAPMAALLDEVQAYAAFNFDRAVRLEAMSADFEKTPAGLQHAAHLYEGEGKVFAMVLAELLAKHRRALEQPAANVAAGEFTAQARELVAAYASRVVGF